MTIDDAGAHHPHEVGRGCVTRGRPGSQDPVCAIHPGRCKPCIYDVNFLICFLIFLRFPPLSYGCFHSIVCIFPWTFKIHVIFLFLVFIVFVWFLYCFFFIFQAMFFSFEDQLNLNYFFYPLLLIVSLKNKCKSVTHALSVTSSSRWPRRIRSCKWPSSSCIPRNTHNTALTTSPPECQ